MRVPDVRSGGAASAKAVAIEHRSPLGAEVTTLVTSARAGCDKSTRRALSEMTETFRARFRFRVGAHLSLASADHRFVAHGREVRLSAASPGIAIRESDWLEMNASGFDTEDEARTFAAELRAAADLSSVAARLGIDSGQDLATAAVNDQLRHQLHQDHAVLVRNNVHGIDVFPDDPNTRIFDFGPTASFPMNPAAFLAGLDVHRHANDALSQNARDVVLLLNYALMRPEPVAQIIFSVSAVEMLGQQEIWSDAQQTLLEELVDRALRSPTGSANERAEVADALKRGLHKVSLRQGVLRLLDRLGLNGTRKAWDAVYAERSTLVHGLAPRPGIDYSGLARRALNLCGAILLRFVAQEVPSADVHVQKFYGDP